MSVRTVIVDYGAAHFKKFLKLCRYSNAKIVAMNKNHSGLLDFFFKIAMTD